MDFNYIQSIKLAQFKSFRSTKEAHKNTNKNWEYSQFSIFWWSLQKIDTEKTEIIKISLAEWFLLKKIKKRKRIFKALPTEDEINFKKTLL